MLDFERTTLQPLVGPRSALLDLGCGTATLACALALPTSVLTLVEKQSGFLAQVPDAANIHKHCCDLEEFAYPDSYDLILLFGVVTHLESTQERAVYQAAAAHLAQDGHFVVKNQVALGGEELRVDRYSEQLGCRYVGRYPAQAEQQSELERLFHLVRMVAYPEQYNKWPDSRHVMFICSRPIKASATLADSA
jgi:SAM-dependent methyltransferase